jgi:thymidylate synthase
VYGDRLSCAMVQRSGDMGLGVPFNIASATLMTYIFAHLTGKKPWKLVHTIHDSHVYLNHVEPLQKQIKRVPYPFPKMKLVDRGQTCVEDFKLEDFELLGYDSYPAIKMKMAV